jgi:hypothetical protein
MGNPATIVTWTSVTLSDQHPTLGKLQFTFPRKMEANPLTDVAPTDPTIRGSQPDNTALWWPNFQVRHQSGPLFWVQGHMLNDNIWGPGNPRNLVPISNTLNTNMLNLVEKEVKQAVKAGKMLKYVVEANWDQTPAKTREVYGLVADGGSLNWGEQFAPTRLSWELYELNFCPITKTLLSSPLSHGSPWYDDPSQWMNHFPGASMEI